jgi:hypothetical protein
MSIFVRLRTIWRSTQRIVRSDIVVPSLRTRAQSFTSPDRLNHRRSSTFRHHSRRAAPKAH